MKVVDKLKKVSDSLTIYFYDNGFMVEICGRDLEDDWKTIKVLCESIEQVNALVAEAAELPKD